MRQIVISSGRIDSLDSFLRRRDKKIEYFYILADSGCISVANLLKEKGFKDVDISDGLGDIDFKKEYVDFIGRLNRRYNSIYWWANTLSYKGNFVSDLCQEVFNYYCIIRLIKNHDRSYIIISNNAALNNGIKSYCKANSIAVKLFCSGKQESVLTYLKRIFWNNLCFLYQGWIRKFIISTRLSKKIKKTLRGNCSYYILKSWLSKGSFSNSLYKDIFFGRLPEYLKQNSRGFFILAGILTDYKDIVLKIEKTEGISIIPQEYFAGYLDYLKVLMLNLLNRVSIKGPVIFCGLEVSDFLKSCLKKDYEAGEINKNLMYFYYAKGLSEKIKVDTFTFTFENQAWERMSILALRKYSPNAKLIGYAHASIVQSQLGYFLSKEEEGLAPLPDKIITAGKEPWLILNSGGNYTDGTKLTEGCALRYEYIYKKEKMSRNRCGNILVAFSINSQYSLKLLNFLRDSLGGIDRYKVILRSHPFTPIDSVIKKWNLSLGRNFSISKNSALENDLQDSSLFIYIDTTSSIEALMLGVPVINIDFKEPTSPDPLFKLNSLKWTISKSNELQKTIDYIYNMNNDEYFKKYEEAAAYLKNYFHPVEERYLREFII